MPPVAIVHGCPRCKGDIAYVVDRQAYCCQAEGCDYSRPTLAPDAKDLVVKRIGQAAATATSTATPIAGPTIPIGIEQTSEPAKDTFTLAELMERWNISEAGVSNRLRKYGGISHPSRLSPVSRASVEAVEREVASWGQGLPRSAAHPTPKVEPELAPATKEAPTDHVGAEPERKLGAPREDWRTNPGTLTNPSDSARRVARLRLGLERIAQACEREAPLIGAMAKLALDFDELEG